MWMIVLTIGIIIGSIITELVVYSPRRCGFLEVDFSDALVDQPLVLHLEKPIDKVIHKKYIVLRISHR